LNATNRETTPDLMNRIVDKAAARACHQLHPHPARWFRNFDRDSVAPIHDRQASSGRGGGFPGREHDSGAGAASGAFAEHDFLTGLPNAMLLQGRVSQAIASATRHNKHVAVLFSNLDGFKHSTDS